MRMKRIAWAGGADSRAADHGERPAGAQTGLRHGNAGMGPRRLRGGPHSLQGAARLDRRREVAGTDCPADRRAVPDARNHHGRRQPPLQPGRPVRGIRHRVRHGPPHACRRARSGDAPGRRSEGAQPRVPAARGQGRLPEGAAVRGVGPGPGRTGEGGPDAGALRRTATAELAAVQARRHRHAQPLDRPGTRVPDRRPPEVGRRAERRRTCPLRDRCPRRRPFAERPLQRRRRLRPSGGADQGARVQGRLRRRSEGRVPALWDGRRKPVREA